MSESAGALGSSIHALLKDYQTVAHNLANASTTGYKRQVNSFSRHLYQRMADGATSDPPPSRIVARGQLDFSQGALVATQRRLDVALQGRGFLVVETPEGPLYTRNGMLGVNGTGQLTDSRGRIVAGADGPIVIPPTVDPQQLSIGADGTISVGQTAFGRLRVVDFGIEEARLEPAGFSAYKAPADTRPNDVADPHVQQGFLEGSNVKLTEELVDLMMVARLYETNMNLMNRHRELTRTILGVATG